MAKFMVLYKSPVSAEEQMSSATPEQAQAGRDAPKTLGAPRQAARWFDSGSPVSQVGVVGGESSPSGGPHIGGFSVLEADSVGLNPAAAR